MPSRAKAAAAVERRSQPKCLVVLPVAQATLVVGEQPEVKFEPGIECALERYQRLQQIRASQARRRTIDDAKAMRELQRQEDMRRPVTDGPDADAVELDGDRGIARLRVRRRHIFRDDRDLIETIPVVPDPIGDFIGGGGFDKSGWTVSPQIGIAELEQVEARRVGCGHGRSQGSAVIERFDIGDDVANAEHAQYVRVSRVSAQVVAVQCRPGWRGEKPNDEGMRLC
jgi:hypothetical protein